MRTDDRVRADKEQGTRRRVLLVGIAVLLAVIAIGAVILLLGDEAPTADEQPVATEALEPATASTEVATAFLEAYGSYDADRAASYLAPEVLNDEFGGPEGLRLETSWAEATGFTRLLGSCEVQDVSSAGTSVRCPYDYHGIRSEELGLGPYSGSWFELAVLDGKIVAASDHIVFQQNGFSDQMWEPFAHWVASTHPDDAAIMYTDRSYTMNRRTEESIALWKQRSLEYVEVVGAR